jgi:hypothetical protein
MHCLGGQDYFEEKCEWKRKAGGKGQKAKIRTKVEEKR